MIEFEYMNYIVELMFGEEMTEELFCRRFAALRELRGIIAGYEKEGFRKDLLGRNFKIELSGVQERRISH